MTAEQPVQPKEIPVLDYGEQPEASNLVLPKSAALSSPAQWTHWHFEVRHKLNQVLDYIEAHLDCSLELEELAQEIGMSQFYFSRLFKQSLGMTPHQYVIQQRVERAKQLLRKGELSLVEISLECGFANQGHLNRHFKRLTGTTPKEIARMYKTSKFV